MAFIELKNTNKRFVLNKKETVVLDNLDFIVEKGEMIAIVGKSGSGKTTLLNILAAIDQPDSGTYLFDGKSVNINNATDGIKFRKNRIGIVVQHFALIDDYTAYDNIELGLWESKLTSLERTTKVDEVMKLLDIYELKDKYPKNLSGGEKQRIAIARAIIGNHQLLLADEPTGSLDSETEKEIIALLKRLNEKGMTIVIVTHDIEVASACNRVVVLEKN